jgi:AcrR family transcriptional regulator
MIERGQTDPITQAALKLFLEQGIKKTTVDEIAHAIGLTRVTIYRRFPQKEQIVQTVFRLLVTPFQKARDWVERDPGVGIEPVLDSIADELAQLPHGDLPSCLDELRRAYPSIHKEFSQARREALTVIFERLFSDAAGQQRLRPGLNRTTVEAYFLEAIINILESPTLLEQGLSPADLYTTIKTIFLYGVLKEKRYDS